MNLTASGIEGELEDGVFDGLRKMHTLNLGDNRISSIGLRVFDGSVLQSLRYVNISWNRIRTLEPWPFSIGVNHTVTIDLAMNEIMSFTNTMR